MPMYAFRCPKCGKGVELYQTLRTNGPTRPFCVEEGCDGQQKMELVFAPPALIFKGSGWTPKGS